MAKYKIKVAMGIKQDDYSLDFMTCDYDGVIYNNYAEASMALIHARSELSNTPNEAWLEEIEE